MDSNNLAVLRPPNEETLGLRLVKTPPIEKRSDTTAVFAGTDVEVDELVLDLSCGKTIDDFLAANPSVRREQVEDVIRGALWTLMDRAQTRKFTHPVPRFSRRYPRWLRRWMCPVWRHSGCDYGQAAARWRDDQIITRDHNVCYGSAVFAWTRIPAQPMVDGLLAGRTLAIYAGPGTPDWPRSLFRRVLEAGVRQLVDTMQMPSVNRDENGRVVGDG